MENPFEYIDPDKHYLTAEDVVENNRYNAWNEGDTNGYARGKEDRYEQIKRQRIEIQSQK